MDDQQNEDLPPLCKSAPPERELEKEFATGPTTDKKADGRQRPPWPRCRSAAAAHGCRATTRSVVHFSRIRATAKQKNTVANNHQCRAKRRW